MEQQDVTVLTIHKGLIGAIPGYFSRIDKDMDRRSPLTLLMGPIVIESLLDRKITYDTPFWTMNLKQNLLPSFIIHKEEREEREEPTVKTVSLIEKDISHLRELNTNKVSFEEQMHIISATRLIIRTQRIIIILFL